MKKSWRYIFLVAAWVLPTALIWFKDHDQNQLTLNLAMLMMMASGIVLGSLKGIGGKSA